MKTGACISGCGKYRYRLHRSWGDGPRVVWVMLNPSTADANKDDATIRRCIGFAMRWGYFGIDVVNLFAYRSTDPRLLSVDADPIGPQNDENIRRIIYEHAENLIVVAWGNLDYPSSRTFNARQRSEYVVAHMLRGFEVKCLGRTESGNPRHPVRLPYSAELVDFRRVA